MKYLLLLIALLCLYKCVPAQTDNVQLIDITGHYTMDNRQKAFSGKMRGFTGDLKIKKLGDSRIVVRLNAEGAANDQGTGYLFDTLKVEKNIAVYRDPISDRSCRVIFTFSSQGVQIVEKSDDYNLNCGFGHGARVDGFYRKISSSAPTDKELKE